MSQVVIYWVILGTLIVLNKVQKSFIQNQRKQKKSLDLTKYSLLLVYFSRVSMWDGKLEQVSTDVQASLWN